MIAPMLVAFAPPGQAAPPKDDTPVLRTPKGQQDNGSDEQGFDKLRDAYYWSRLLAGDDQLTLSQAAGLRNSASTKASGIGNDSVRGAARGGTWSQIGPNPIVQNGRTTNAFEAVSGRIGALAIRKDGTIILGAAQGGVWTYNATTQSWTSRTKDSDTQSVGALAIAPSNDNVVYMGSGEGALSGDSYYGDGIYRSADGGVTWKHVSSLFVGQAVSAIAVDPANANHLYATTLRGRGGARRTSAPASAPYGVWESTDGGRHWTLRKGTTNELHGATDLVLDPQNSKVVWASFWGDGIYRSTDGGVTWASALGNLPQGNFLEGGTRFSLGISRPSASSPAVVYTGFDYFDNTDAYHESQVYKTSDNGVTWNATPTGSGSDSVLGYCGTQCFYDNVIKVDPTNPNVVYVLGLYGYDFSPPSGGVWRSTDGGQTWKSLGYDLHPDFHAFAFQPNDTKHIAIGNDGGVWQSKTGGGRNGATDPLSAADWEDLNGTVNPATAALIHSTGLAISQFTSIATVPQVAGQYWGGTQDNGTLRSSLANSRWFDQSSGDGGQVIVDQSTVNPINPTGAAAYVFGEYYSISPYRFDPSEVGTFFGNEYIRGGINLKDRSEFYVPWVQNRGNVNQMFLGTYRLYRSDNVEAPKAGDVHFTPISGDLTTGCTGAAPNGARGCLISAIGLADGGDGVYVGSDDGVVSVSPNAVTSDSPTWTQVGQNRLPNRPVTQFAVDRSNWRIAYASYAGFGAATPSRRGHVFATTDGGKHWQDVSANLPDIPVNSVVLDPSDHRTVYVGTDVGAFVSTNGGHSWLRLGSGMPKVAVWQLDYDPSHGVLAAGTHGRGAYTLTNRNAEPALVVSKKDSGLPVGPGRNIDYTITVKNLGNAAATGVKVTDPIPAHTSFSFAGNGGTSHGGVVTWRGLSIPAGGSIVLTYSTRIAPRLSSGVKSIVNDGIRVRSDQGVSTTGSPHVTPIAPANAVAVTPAAQTGGARVGQQASYVEHVTNNGYKADSYTLSTAGSWTSATYDATCTTAMTSTVVLQPGSSTDVCVKVTVPATAANDVTSDTTLTATSDGDSSVSGSATLTTIAVAVDTLLVDNDNNAPDVAAKYQAALTANGTAFSTWDLLAHPVLPQSYLTAHKTVVWFTGNSYPAPITPYESELKALLDGGGRLFMSGQDILDQAAGTTTFVHDYLHINWDGTDVQNDKATVAVHGVTGNPVTNGIGSVPLDHSVLNANFEDQITPIAPATPAFTDDSGAPDALTVASGTYKVMFLAFPFEAYGTAAQQASLMGQALTYLGS
ncbi:hypothetical protein M6D93_05830 [Jatrophihabitans telluris]|uniref:DUF11 domain-containing protein n=1 Tax=Jatrophihabitans telluris TaxID=2038343 RepID=A0ABY4R171_9ACTN|nr:hypothetical protein [Jatrophihabitans telluris]UQX89525.1 hypothetical protein M6D93_05830 [Jatrophihabitans telluris]